MEKETTKNKILGMSPELFWTILSTIVIGAFFWGHYIGLAKFDKDKSDYYEGNKTLKLENENLKQKLDSIQNYKPSIKATTYDIFVNGSLGSGFDLGVNTSEDQKTWAKIVNKELYMNYPTGQNWGAVFITVGKSTYQLSARAFQDFSMYKTLVLELKGKTGTTFSIGLKDNLDPDDGHESRYPITFKSDDWNTYEINLNEFKSADLHKLYMLTEFAFDSNPQILSVRKIQFK